MSFVKIIKVILPENLYKFCRKNILFFILWNNTFFYRLRIPLLIKTISKKERINVVFFVRCLAMWRSDSLFELLLNNLHFSPIIIHQPYEYDNKDVQEKDELALVTYCANKNYPIMYPYISRKSINPDIIFYSQPYDTNNELYKISSFKKSSLFVYIPYGLGEMKDKWIYQAPLRGYCWKIFYATEQQVLLAHRYSLFSNKNSELTGFPTSDRYYCGQYSIKQWKIKDDSIRRVIWAPHHSILPTDFLNYSNFLSIADNMVLLCEKYKNSVQFAFRPHPGLKSKLYKSEIWGKEKTDAYYDKWKMMENSIISTDDYVDLFMSSDAMIHDCSGFTIEYLYTGKPVFYIAKPGHESFLNDMALKAFACHYQGLTIADIERFIVEVVINRNDTKHSEREQFQKQYLTMDGHETVAYRQMCSICKGLNID